MNDAARACSRTWRSVLLVVLVALAVRAGALGLGLDAARWNDQETYVERANDLLDGKGYTGSYQSWVRHTRESRQDVLPGYAGAYQAPGFPAFIALVMTFAGRGEGGLAWVKLAQIVLGALTAGLVYAIGREWYGHRAGLAAAWLFALDPTLVAFTHYLFTETLFVGLFTASVYALVRARVTSLGAAAATGVGFALAAYVKSSVLYLLPLLAAWFAWKHRARLAPAARWIAVAALAWSACVAPWTIRNWNVHGGFVLIDSSGPFNFWRGNQPNAYALRRAGLDTNARFPAPFSAFVQNPVADVGVEKLVAVAAERCGTSAPSDLQIMRAANAAALEYILADPAWSLERACYKVLDLWNPTSFVLRHLAKGGYGELSPAVEASLAWACVLAYLLVAALALPALWMLRRDASAQLVLLLIAYYTALHAVTFGLTRFRLPVMPFLMLLAGWSVAAWWERRRAKVGA